MTDKQKQPKQQQAPVVKEAARIEDRPITMAPKESIEAGKKFFQAKMQRQAERVRNRLAAGLPADQPTDAEIVAAVKAASATGQVTLTVMGADGVERPTQILTLLLKQLRDD